MANTPSPRAKNSRPSRDPSVATGSASSVTQTAATLNATVDPNEGQLTSCELEYGTSTAYGSSAPCSPGSAGGNVVVAVSAGLAGLAPNTTYHFRIVATNAGGTAHGSDHTFATLPLPPAVSTGSPSAVTRTSAILSASVNPNGGAVTALRVRIRIERGLRQFGPVFALAGIRAGAGNRDRGACPGSCPPAPTTTGSVRATRAEPAPAPTRRSPPRRNRRRRRLPSDPPKPPPPACALALASTTVTIQKQGWLVVNLTRSGSAVCSGRLTFTYRTRARNGRLKSVTLAAGAFTLPADLPPGRASAVKVHLGTQARALLSAIRGHFSASLTLQKLSPQPVQSVGRTVRLVPEPAPAAKSKH